MNWITVYITGKGEFREEVRRRLESSSIRFMPGYTDNGAGLDTHDLYWLDEEVDLRTFKEAIGSKLVWKYRLNFFTSLEAFIEGQKNQRKEASDVDEEKEFLLKMQSSS